MTTPEEGTDYVDVRSMWPREDLDFTRWLAEHLDMLSEALGVNLKLVQKEKSVGPFYCDILAIEVGTGTRVAIENQLELADHSHLGQLLTYAVGLDARIAVWVAPQFLYEHAEALDRLNKCTGDGLRFYGVKVMVSRTGAGLEPRLCPVVTPDGWNKKHSLPRGAVDPRKQRFSDFFDALIDKLSDIDFPDWVTHNFSPADRLFRCRPDSGIGYAASLEGNGYAWVTLHIRMEDTELTKTVFDELFRSKEAIEASIPDQDWQWYRHDNYLFSSINIRRPGSIDDPPEKLEETGTWMLDMLPKLKEVFDPRVTSTLKELYDERGG